MLFHGGPYSRLSNGLVSCPFSCLCVLCSGHSHQHGALQGKPAGGPQTIALIVAVAPTLLLMVQCCHLASIVSGSFHPIVIRKPGSALTFSTASPGPRRLDAAKLLSGAGTPSPAHAFCFREGKALIASFQTYLVYPAPGGAVSGLTRKLTGGLRLVHRVKGGCPAITPVWKCRGGVGQRGNLGCNQAEPMPQLTQQEVDPLELAWITLQGGFKLGQGGQAPDGHLNELAIGVSAERHADLGRGSPLWLQLAFPGGLS